ncbi:RidA family protein [bacterium]|nr:RidA family protein [bacterium]
MSKIEEKLKDLGFELPVAAKPVAAYIPAIRVGNLVMTSGQLPTIDGELHHVGHVGGRVLPAERAARQAERACLNALAAVKGVIGDLDKIKQIVRVVVYVQCEADFHSQPVVANGASELLLQLFGEDRGRHVRSAVGTNALPLNSPVELELTVEVED